MKNIWKIALLAAALMTSCTQPSIDEVTPEQGGVTGEEIQFYTVGDDSRTTYFEGEGLGIHWEEGDQIAVRRYDAAITSDLRQRANYKADNSGATTTFTRSSSDTWPLISWLEDKDTYIAAYYPSTNNAGINNIDIYLSSAQTQATAGDHSHIGDLMYMKSEPQVFAPDNHPSKVELKFKNLYSVIELTLKSTVSNKKVSKVELISSNTPLTISDKGNINLNTSFADDIANGLKFNTSKTTFAKTCTLTITEPALLDADGEKFYFVVLPGNHAAGELTIRTSCEDGSFVETAMGAINFEMNKVYRPVLALNDFETKTIADIKHIFSDFDAVTYQEPMVVAEGVSPILGREYKMFNYPTNLIGCQIATIQYTQYPTCNRIQALNDGYVYIMTGSTDMTTKSHEAIIAEGWTAVTNVVNSGDKVADAGNVYYGASEGTASGNMVIYERKMVAGEEYDFLRLCDILTKFQGIRPIAKSITNEICNEIAFDFTSTPSGWTSQGTFVNVLANPIKGDIVYKVTATASYTLNCSYTMDGETYTGSIAHSTGGYLLMHIRGSKKESVGMPAIEGYKLTKVTFTQSSSGNSSNVVMSSTAAPEEIVAVSNSVKPAKGASATMELENPAANTSYYFYGTTTNNDIPRPTKIVLTYEKAE
ncbi:MAG: fimbrillin family protein [Tidjanibacter sp.]|nr:fimbrillin family protein [Tidjanibacter sp.]